MVVDGGSSSKGSNIMSSPKHPQPPRVRAKVGSKRSRTKLLALGEKYVSGQAAADPGNKLAAEAKAVAAARTGLLGLVGKRSDLKAQLDTTSGAIVVADVQYADALDTYAAAAAAFSIADASLLAQLGVDKVLAPTKPADEVLGTPVVTIQAGLDAGDVRLRCKRVPHAGAYLFEYKLEPSQASDPWLGNITTKLASTTVTGLAGAQLVRARVRAIGVTPGPWSAEMVGRAK
jgi:hypothetical protein